MSVTTPTKLDRERIRELTEREARQLEDMLTSLTAILLGLELLQTRTPLSERQGRLVAEALRAARTLEAALLGRIAGDAG